MIKLYIRFFIFIICAAALLPLCCQEWEPPREWQIPAFEKIYVTPHDILSTPEGTFYVNSSGVKEKIRALRSDWHGTYVIKYQQQCPICGRCYDDHKVQD